MMGNNTSTSIARTLVQSTKNHAVFLASEVQDYVQSLGSISGALEFSGELQVFNEHRCIGFAAAISDSCILIPTDVVSLREIIEDLTGEAPANRFSIGAEPKATFTLAKIMTSTVVTKIGKSEFHLVQIAEGLLPDGMATSKSNEGLDIIKVQGYCMPGQCARVHVDLDGTHYFLIGIPSAAEFSDETGEYDEGLFLASKYVRCHAAEMLLAVTDIARIGEPSEALAEDTAVAPLSLAAMKKIAKSMDLDTYIPATADSAWLEFNKQYKKWSQVFSSGGPMPNKVLVKQGTETLTFIMNEYDAKVISAYTSELTDTKFLSSKKILTRVFPDEIINQEELSAASADDSGMGIEEDTACWVSYSKVEEQESAGVVRDKELKDVLSSVAQGKRLQNHTSGKHLLFTQLPGYDALKVKQSVGKPETACIHPFVCGLRAKVLPDEQKSVLRKFSCCRPSCVLGASKCTKNLLESMTNVAHELGKETPSEAIEWWNAQSSFL